MHFSSVSFAQAHVPALSGALFEVPIVFEH